MNAFHTHDVVIIGGGITGLTAAYELARLQHKVCVLEQGELGSMATGWNLGGVRQSGRPRAEFAIAMAAVERWGQLDQELGADVGYRRNGNLRLARSDDELQILTDMVTDQRRMGLDLNLIDDVGTLRELAPWIAPEVVAASYCHSDGHADPQLATQAYADAAVRLGARIETGVRIEKLVSEGNRVTKLVTTNGVIPVDYVVVVAGVHTDELLAPLDIDLPISIQHVAVAKSMVMESFMTQVFSSINGDCAGRQDLDGCLLVTAGIEEWRDRVFRRPIPPDSVRPRVDQLEKVIARASRVFPSFASTPIKKVWGGLMDMTPDRLPIIDKPEGWENLVVAAGFSGHGFGIGPVTGALIRDLVTGDRTSFDITPFRSNRFETEAVASPPAELLG